VTLQEHLAEAAKGTMHDEYVPLAKAERAIIESVIDTLNRIHAADPTVLPALINHRVECNEAVADDPSVQVTVVPAVQPGSGSEPKDGTFMVGFLGILNGICGVDARTVGYIAALYDDDHKLTRFAWNGVE
jgi:hypothetical protein